MGSLEALSSQAQRGVRTKAASGHRAENPGPERIPAGPAEPAWRDRLSNAPNRFGPGPQPAQLLGHSSERGPNPLGLRGLPLRHGKVSTPLTPWALQSSFGPNRGLHDRTESRAPQGTGPLQVTETCGGPPANRSNESSVWPKGCSGLGRRRSRGGLASGFRTRFRGGRPLR